MPEQPHNSLERIYLARSGELLLQILVLYSSASFTVAKITSAARTYHGPVIGLFRRFYQLQITSLTISDYSATISDYLNIIKHGMHNNIIYGVEFKWDWDNKKHIVAL